MKKNGDNAETLERLQASTKRTQYSHGVCWRRKKGDACAWM